MSYRSLRREAIVAIDGPVKTRHERYLCFAAAIGADNRCGSTLTRRRAIAAAVGPAIPTPLRFVRLCWLGWLPPLPPRCSVLCGERSLKRGGSG